MSAGLGAWWRAGTDADFRSVGDLGSSLHNYWSCSYVSRTGSVVESRHRCGISAAWGLCSENSLTCSRCRTGSGGKILIFDVELHLCPCSCYGDKKT
jgi:hypothetical protein